MFLPKTCKLAYISLEGNSLKRTIRKHVIEQWLPVVRLVDGYGASCLCRSGGQSVAHSSIESISTNNYVGVWALDTREDHRVRSLIRKGIAAEGKFALGGGKRDQRRERGNDLKAAHYG